MTPYMAKVDVDNCFYRLLIDHDLGRFFCLPPIRASEAGLYLVRGKVGDVSDLVWPHLSVLPMGFSWSLFIAQEINAATVACSNILPDARFLTAPGVAGRIEKETDCVYYVYVDNIGVISGSRETARLAISEAADCLNQVGLICHAVDGAGQRIHRARRRLL